jgi:hypothetical protein
MKPIHIVWVSFSHLVATTLGVTGSSLEQLYRHTGTTMQALGAINVGSGAFMDVSRIVKDF